MSAREHGASWDFFVSYTASDRAWAEWIAWQLEEAGYQVLIQAWDIVPGDHWMGRMEDGVRGSRKVIAVLSHAYLTSVYGRVEWEAAFRADPHGQARKVIPIRIQDCPRPTLLGAVVSFDLYGLDADTARARLLDSITATVKGRAKPLTEPAFPNTLIPPVTSASPGTSLGPKFPTSGPVSDPPRRADGAGLRRYLVALVSLIVASALAVLSVLAWGYLDSLTRPKSGLATTPNGSTAAGITTATLLPAPTATASRTQATASAHLSCTVEDDEGSGGHKGAHVVCRGGGSDDFFASVDCERLDDHSVYRHKGTVVSIGGRSTVWCDLNAKVIRVFYTPV
ncbi:toll/interleukin-1 receptor domain-containing protein [Frankia sp. Mgl5]|uniref:toll/interleukin-1 receptor domain-containing protein n=1 Tax=Frankia sp. Mgl5 TaxID=2933793 RepID=UPI00200E86BF|nr:toll/interleukin-1 receptor domain-containing protein [Frankia sp. Mgl5]MCK9929809.1 toll/interleukin-1 receptor domain-containing protein [Frankia sp. Mgl5]